MDVMSLINKFNQSEKQLIHSTFVAPVIKGSKICVRIDGVIYDFKLAKKDLEKEGWLTLKPINYKTAKVVDEAEPYLIEEYKKLFPTMRMILADQAEGVWVAFPSNRQVFQKSFGLDGYQLVRLVDGVQKFDQIVVRFDGANLWFDGVDVTSDFSVSDYLRDSLEKKVTINKISHKGLTPEQKGTYAFVYELLKERTKKEQAATMEGRIKIALEHADASLHRFMEHKDALTISWVTRSGGHYTATVQKNDLRVISSGVCLSGQDKKFDLTSLVSVMEEREKRGLQAPGFRTVRRAYNDGGHDPWYDDED